MTLRADDARDIYFTVNYTASISDFFKSPKWGTNLLLGGVCLLIPLVGSIVLNGWHITIFWARKDQDPAKIPDFDFNQFGKYLERGLWPFLVGLVVSIVIVPFFMIFMFMVMGGLAAFAGPDSHHESDGVFAFLAVAAMLCLYVFLIFSMILVSAPLVIRATITQDFGQAFSIAFFKRFIALVWTEIVLAALFMLGAGFLLLAAGMLACYVGMFFTMPLSVFAWHHLQKQLYDLYLSRGGEPVPLSLKLMDGPPPLPSA